MMFENASEADATDVHDKGNIVAYFEASYKEKAFPFFMTPLASSFPSGALFPSFEGGNTRELHFLLPERKSRPHYHSGIMDNNSLRGGKLWPNFGL